MAKGLKPVKEYWIFERYHTPRFTKPDENGYVIMDYCIYVDKDYGKKKDRIKKK